LISSTISRRYAKALLSIGQEDGQYEEYGHNLQEFVGFCSTNEEFSRVISNQIFSAADRKKILEIALEKGSFSDVIKNFLRLLIDKNRIRAIKEIADYYSILTDKVLNIARANIITARPLKNKALDKLEKALVVLTSKKVKVDMKEDKSIIGGLIVKIEDLVLDGSVRAQLERLRVSLKRSEYN